MRYDDIKTSIDCRYLAHRDQDGMAEVNAWIAAKRKRLRRRSRFWQMWRAIW